MMSKVTKLYELVEPRSTDRCRWQEFEYHELIQCNSVCSVTVQVTTDNGQVKTTSRVGFCKSHGLSSKYKKMFHIKR